MKSEKNILTAFLLNISFAVFEFVGGIFTNSIAIISDAVHDLGDALSIGLAFILEKKSKKTPNDKYTFGYTRYSVLGAFITSLILFTGAILVIYSSVNRLFNPQTVNYNGMIIFAIFGVIVNFLAAYKTSFGNSINEKTVSLHMFEDVLGWLIVLVGAIVMKFTDILILDPILSILVSTFILVKVLKRFKEVLDLFLEKTPNDISVQEIKRHLLKNKDIKDVHHIHIWSMDGKNNYATMHVVSDNLKIKDKIRKELKEYGINHVTIELEDYKEKCNEEYCNVETIKTPRDHHHH